MQGDNQIRLVKAMAWATSLIAMILGSLGVLNTMMMAVFGAAPGRSASSGPWVGVGSVVLNMLLGEATAARPGSARRSDRWPATWA